MKVKLSILLFSCVLLSCKKSNDVFTGTWVHNSDEAKIYNDTLKIKKTNDNGFSLGLKISYKSKSKFSETKIKLEKFTGSYDDKTNSIVLNNGKALFMDKEGILVIGTTKFIKAQN